jgi:hypothetical protein
MRQADWKTCEKERTSIIEEETLRMTRLKKMINLLVKFT